MASCPDQHLSVRMRVLDTEFAVLCDEPTAAAVGHLYSPFLTSHSVPAGARHEAVRVVDAGDLSLAVAEINALAVAEVGNLAVHAGAVAADGSVVAFPAVSGAGKTTLTAACLLAGLHYVSDEALCLDWQDAAVRPYPRPLALSPWSAAALGLEPGGGSPDSGDGGGPHGGSPDGGGGPVRGLGDEVLVTAAGLGAPVAARPLRLSHVVLLDPPGGEPGLRPATRSDGAAELLRRSFTHWHHPDRAFELVHQVLAEVSVWRLSPSSPMTDAATIATLLGAPATGTRVDGSAQEGAVGALA